MKRMLALILVMTTIFLTASAETTFDPAQYTEEELREIDTLIHMHLSKTEEGTVLYDENGIYVEYRGLYKGYFGYGVNIFIQNTSGQRLSFVPLRKTVNKASFEWFDAHGFQLNDGTMHLTKPDNEWCIEYEDLREWGFTAIQNIEFIIWVYDKEKEIDFEIPVSLTLDYQIV